METADLRKSIHKLIDQADEKFLRMVHSLAREYLKDDKEIVAFKFGRFHSVCIELYSYLENHTPSKK